MLNASVAPNISVCYWGLPNYSWASQVALVIKNLPANAEDIRDVGSIPALGRSPGGGNGNPLQYSCLENPIDKESGGLKSMRSQRVRHNWSDLACTHKLEVCACVCVCAHVWCAMLGCYVCVHVFCSPMDSSLPGSSFQGIYQARIQEWIVISSSKGSSQCKDQTHISCIGWQILTTGPFGKPMNTHTHTHTHIFRVKFNFLFLCIM